MFLTIFFSLMFAGFLGAFFAFERDSGGTRNDWAAHVVASLLACIVGLGFFSPHTNYFDFLVLSVAGSVIAAMCLRAVLMVLLAWWRGSNDRHVDTCTLAFAFLVGASCAAGDAKLVVVVMLMMAAVSVYRGGIAPASMSAAERAATFDFVLQARNSLLQRLKIALPFVVGLGPLARAAKICSETNAVSAKDPNVRIVAPQFADTRFSDRHGLANQSSNAQIETAAAPLDPQGNKSDLTIPANLKLIAELLRSENGSAQAIELLGRLNSVIRECELNSRGPVRSVTAAPAKPRASGGVRRLPSHNVAVRQGPLADRHRCGNFRVRSRVISRRGASATS